MKKSINLGIFFLYILPGIIFCIYFIYRGSFETPYGRQFTLSDTSMVSMTYAKTFINTGQLIWYEGAERVQGFSNFLYTIFFAFLHLFKFSYSINSLIVSSINVVVLVLISYKVVTLCNIFNSKNLHFNYFLGALVFFQYPLVFWSLRGYEVGVLTLITITVIERLFKINERNKIESFKEFYVLLFYLSLGIWITLDFLIVALTITLYTTIFLRKKIESYEYLIYFNLGIFFSIFLLLALQHSYYGDYFPNTFYLETGGFYLIEKIPRGIISSFKIFPILLIQIYLFIKNLYDKSYTKNLHLVLLISTTLIVYNILEGGDNWEVYGFANRKLTLLIPVGLVVVSFIEENKFFSSNKLLNILFSILLIFGVFLQQLSILKIININISNFYLSRFEITYITVSCLAILLLIYKKYSNYLIALLFTIFISFTHINYLVNTELQISSTEFLNTQIGIELKNFTTKDAKIGVLWAGNIAYYSERNMIDFLGKSDKYIAKSEPIRVQNKNKYNITDFDPGHNKWNFQYSIGELSPDVIIRTWDDLEFYEQIKKNGYEKICVVFKDPFDSEEMEIYIKKGSSKVIKENIIFCKDK